MLDDAIRLWLVFSCISCTLALAAGLRAVRQNRASVLFVAATMIVVALSGPLGVIFFCAMGMLDYYRECGDERKVDGGEDGA